MSKHISFLSLFLLSVGCGSEKVPGQSVQYEQKTRLTATPKLADDNWSRIPGAENERGELVLPKTTHKFEGRFEPAPFSFTEESMQKYRGIAESSLLVKHVLGERYAYIRLDPVDPPKGKEKDAYEAVLTFFSYTENKGAEVHMKNEQIISAKLVDIWPTEGLSEVLEAVEIARNSEQLRGRVNDLEAGGMLAQLVTGKEAWIGRRVFDVRFFTPVESVSMYYATIDLTNKTVLAAGPVDVQQH